MEEKELKALAEEVANTPPLDAELEKQDIDMLKRFISQMSVVWAAQFSGYGGKKRLIIFLAYVYHEGIQLGIKLAIVNRRLGRR